jgi:hypothetical protein
VLFYKERRNSEWAVVRVEIFMDNRNLSSPCRSTDKSLFMNKHASRITINYS